MKKVLPYSVLAQGYDAVMAHVRYERWAQYIHSLIQRYAPGTSEVLELGCGTGSFILALYRVGGYKQVGGSDRSEAMLAVARQKAQRFSAPARFWVEDFTRLSMDSPWEAIVLIYDGLNYVLHLEEVARTLQGIYHRVKPGGLFVFDQSTPANSLNNAGYFEDMGKLPAFSYIRRSEYDSEQRLHRTYFLMEYQGEQYLEEHVERAYELQEMAWAIEQTPFIVEGVFHEMTDQPGTEASERLHWVLRRPSE